MLDIKRKLDELLAIYTFEEDIVDIYVEGPTDKFIIENYIDYRKVDKSVIEIDTIDLSQTQETFTDLDLRSNKDKLIALSRILSVNNIQCDIKCVVDRDFDGILNELCVNDYIYYTDYSCIESYILCKRHIEKILKVGITNFPHDPEIIINEISKVLNGLFLLRMVNKKFSLNFAFPKIENNISIDKKTGICKFNFNNYLDLYINVNKLRDQKDEILNFIKEVSNIQEHDIRFNMNGHDFIEVLFNYVNKIKNTANFRIDNFERAIYLSIQPNFLENYQLFQNLAP